MDRTDPRRQAATATRQEFLPVLMLLFVGSGCAALIYEIVWLQMLQLVIGSTAVSLGVLLGTFMGGMCLGSLLLPRFVSASRHPLAVYAVLELAIGVVAWVLWLVIPLVENLYAAEFTGGQTGVLVRGILAGVCLLPPTLLMGATLPAIARWVESTPRGVSWLGLFYGGNIGGAVCGCLLAGFYILPNSNVLTATAIAFTINVIVALIALLLAMLSPHQAPRDNPNELPERKPKASLIYVGIGLSGAAALGAEVVWTRLISLMLGGTVYTFSIILSVFLVGLGIGSSGGSLAARNVRSPAWALATCQTLLIVAIFWTSHMVSNSMPYWPIDPTLSTNSWHVFQLDFLRTAWAILPATILWGASFPLALATVAARGQDPGRLVGRVYAANTLGAILGAVLFAVWIVPTWGTVWAQQALLGVTVTAVTIVLLFRLLQPLPSADTGPSQAQSNELANPTHVLGWELIFRAGAVLTIALAAILGGIFASGMQPVPWGMVAYGRHMAGFNSTKDLIPGRRTKEEVNNLTVKQIEEFGDEERDKLYGIYVGEGVNVSVAVSYSRDGTLAFHGAGKVQASNMPDDMRLQRLLGHISALAVENPRDVLVVACGAGVTAGSFIVHPEVENITICDIEPLVPTTVTPMFHDENFGVVTGIDKQNPLPVKYGDVSEKQVRVVYDDGRHFVRTTQQKFDVITSDPIDPWVKGCAAMNTVEYYQMCKDHLNDGGVMTLWIPLYESDEATFKSVLATFFRVFPNGVLWSNENSDGEGYDAVLFGIKDEDNSGYKIDLDKLVQRMQQDDHKEVLNSLRYVNFGSDARMRNQDGELVWIAESIALDMLSTYAGQARDLTAWSKDAEINTDRNLRLQYLAGMAFNQQIATDVLNGVLKHYRFPGDLFVGSGALSAKLKRRLRDAGRIGPLMGQ